MSHFVLLPLDEKAQLDASRRKAEVTRLVEEARKQAEEGSTDIAEAVVSFATELDAAASGTDFKFATAQLKQQFPSNWQHCFQTPSSGTRSKLRRSARSLQTKQTSEASSIRQ